MRLLHAARQAEVVVVLRKTFTAWLRPLLRAAAKHLVLDIDDAVFVRDDGSPSFGRQHRFAAMARTVNAVWAGNTYLNDYAWRYCRTTALLPTSIDPQLYVPIVQSSKFKVQGSLPTAGDWFDVVWIGSSATRKYIAGLMPALVQAAKEIPRLRVKIVGDFSLSLSGNPGGPGTGGAGPVLVSVPWSEAAEGAELASAHVGLAPMPDDAWTRGKCGLKVLQYMAAGLPVVAARVGVHRDIVLDGRTGFLAGDERQWVEALRRLHTDAAQRAAMGATGRARVVEHYSVPVTFAKMLRSLEGLTGQ
jgi:glycosyltransferase involved in cell wall biosynthesis